MPLIEKNQNSENELYDNPLELIEKWFDSQLGTAVLEAEQGLIGEKLNRLFGYHLMQLSVNRNTCLFEQSPIRHKFCLSEFNSEHNNIGAIAELDKLPVDAESIDVGMLHHVLEYSNNPHQLLKEASRVIVPNGHILIAGYNPWSMLGLRTLAGGKPNRKGAQGVWCNQLLSARRIQDWLALLDFRVEQIDYLFYAPPINNANVLAKCHRLEEWGRRWNLPVGGTYVIHAIKVVAGMTPRRPAWKEGQGLITIPLVKPTASINPRHHTIH
jgi:SAM-dependent methyltransferase